LVEGDDAGLLGAAIRADGSLRAAIADAPRDIGLGFADSPDGATFGAPVAALRRGTFVDDVAFAADGSGLATVSRRGAKTTDVVAFDAAGTMSGAPLLRLTGRWIDLAVAPSGAAVVAWALKGAKGAEVDAAFREPGAAAFGPAQRAGYSTTDDAIVRAGIGDAGGAVVTWQVNRFPSKVAAAVRLPGAGFSPARYVSPAAGDAQLAVGPGGQAILTAAHGRRLDVSAKAPNAARMPIARTVDRAPGEAYVGEAAAAAGPRTVAAAWTAADAKRRLHVRVLVGTATGTVRRVGVVGTRAEGDAVALGVSATGAAVVAWQEALRARKGDPAARSRLGVAVRLAGGRFGAPTWMGPVSLDDAPELALLRGGRGYVAYEAFQSGDAGELSYRRVYVAGWRP
jgi:hypothetical protein